MVVKNGAVAGNCASSPCTVQFSTALLPGYDHGEIWLTDFLLQFGDDDDHKVRRVHAEVNPVGLGYNQSTGDFEWTVTAAFEAYPTPPNPSMSFAVSFMIMAVDGVNAILTRKTIAPIVPAGGGPCTTVYGGAACENPNPLVGVATPSVPFQRAFVSGFDFELSAGAGIDVREVSLQTFYTAFPGASDAQGTSRIAFRGSTGVGGPPSADVNAEVKVVALALVNSETFLCQVDGTVTSGTNTTNMPEQLEDNNPFCPDMSPDSFGAYLGMKDFALVTVTPTYSPIQQIYAGCGNLVYQPYGMGGPLGEANYIWHWALLSQGPNPVIEYNGTNFCLLGFLKK